MQETLTRKELDELIRSVFSPRPGDCRLAILVDLPDHTAPDNENWMRRRTLAAEWHKALCARPPAPVEEVHLILYPNIHSNNADLPEQAFLFASPPGEPLQPETLSGCAAREMTALLGDHPLIMAITEFSATAPLKILAARFGFRAATMPGFSAAMIPALRLDYKDINRRVVQIKACLDPADVMDISFTVDGKDTHDFHIDLQNRQAHVSGGRFPDPGMAGNLPSGECYIVPYEGEGTVASRTHGILPVQFKDEVVLYQVHENRAVRILSKGVFSRQEKKKIEKEPAYGNIAEIGFGVLRDFGIQPVGEMLLDEKLGLHIAFGRSDHFGGTTGVRNFTSPEQVVHIDRIYIPEIQNRIHVDEVVVRHNRSRSRTIMRNGQYTIF